MSKLTIFLMLYGICIHIAAPKQHIRNFFNERCTDTISANNMEDAYKTTIPSNVDQQCQSDTQTITTEATSTPVQETRDEHDFRKLVKLSAYKVLVRKKRLISTNYRDSKDHFFVKTRDHIDLPCDKYRTIIPSSDWTLNHVNYGWAKGTTFIWRDAHNKAFANKRYQVMKNGELRIEKAKLSDTGKYWCTYTTTKATAPAPKKKTSVFVTVFEYPVLYVDITLVFYVKSCSNKKMKAEITAKIRKVVCPTSFDCRVKLKAECKTYPKRDPKLGPPNEYRVTISKGLPSGYRPAFCQPKCVIKRMKKFLKEEGRVVIQNSQQATKFFRHSGVKVKMRCPGGFTMHQDSMCLACGPGTYSTGVEKKCIPCPRGHYQSKLGINKCRKCPHGKATAKNGTTSVSHCKEFQSVAVDMAINSMKMQHYVAIGAAPVVLILCCLICCCASCGSKTTEEKALLFVEANTEDIEKKPYAASAKRRNKEKETTANNKAIGQSTSGSHSYEINNMSIRKHDSRVSRQQSTTRNINNSRWIRTDSGWIHTTSNTSSIQRTPTRSRILDKVAARNSDHRSLASVVTECNRMPHVENSYKLNLQNCIPMRTNPGNTHDNRQDGTDIVTSPADIPQYNALSCKKITSDLKVPTTRRGGGLSARLSVAQLPVSRSALPESSSLNYAIRRNSLGNSFYQDSIHPYLPCQLLENSEAGQARSHNFRSGQTNHKPLCKNRTFEALQNTVGNEKINTTDRLSVSMPNQSNIIGRLIIETNSGNRDKYSNLKVADGPSKINLQSRIINDDQLTSVDLESLKESGGNSTKYLLLKKTRPTSCKNLSQKSTSVQLQPDPFVSLPVLQLTTFPGLVLGEHLEPIAYRSPDLASNIVSTVSDSDAAGKLHRDAAPTDLLDFLTPCNGIPLPPPPQPNTNVSENSASSVEFPSPPPPI